MNALSERDARTFRWILNPSWQYLHDVLRPLTESSVYIPSAGAPRSMILKELPILWLRATGGGKNPYKFYESQSGLQWDSLILERRGEEEEEEEGGLWKVSGDCQFYLALIKWPCQVQFLWFDSFNFVQRKTQGS